jgi:hypothetical protein
MKQRTYIFFLACICLFTGFNTDTYSSEAGMQPYSGQSGTDRTEYTRDAGQSGADRTEYAHDASQSGADRTEYARNSGQSGTDRTEMKEDLNIRYAKPASGWLESLPLGNGRIGAMVFGGISEERIVLNEATLYSREYSIFDTLPDISRHIDILARMVKNGDCADADEYATRHVTGPAVPCYQPLGDIVMQFSGQEDASRYTRTLDLSAAVAKVDYQSQGTAFAQDAGSKDRYPVLYDGKGIEFETKGRIHHCDGKALADGSGLTVKDAGEVVIIDLNSAI